MLNTYPCQPIEREGTALGQILFSSLVVLVTTSMLDLEGETPDAIPHKEEEIASLRSQ